MTYQDFLEKFRKKNAFDKYWSYFISILVIAIGLFFIYSFYFTDWGETKNDNNSKNNPATDIWGIYIFPELLIMVGLYGFWRIPKTYQVTCIESNHSIVDKNLIINQLINDFKLTELENNDQYRHLKYVGRFWNTFDIYIFLDTINFYLNAQQIDFGNDGGFIDFGTSKKVTNKMKDKILTYL